jgi:IS30 family transposase
MLSRCRSRARGWDRAQRPKKCRLSLNRRLRAIVAAGLERDWSPQQIAEWLKMGFPNDPSMRVSHGTIYRTLFVQARGALKKELLAHLRSGRKRRQRRTFTRSQAWKIYDTVSVRERPAEIEDRAVPGHWEGDLLMGGPSSQIATLVERQTRFVMLVKLPRADAATVAAALTKQIKKLPAVPRKSLTWDCGGELARHK